MAFGFLTPPAGFIGRDEYVARFKARMEHYGFFLYGGIAGIGKTGLLLRLGRETKRLGLKGSLYVALAPGETIPSLFSRVEAMAKNRGSEPDRQGDPFGRLVALLERQKLALLLDDVHYLRREDLLSLIRAVRTRRGSYRVLAAGRGDQELPAIDSAEIHVERVGPLSSDEVRKVAESGSVRGEALERLVADAARGGCSGHALTLRFLVACGSEAMPPDTFFVGQSSRSVSAFKLLMEQASKSWDPKEIEALKGLAKVATPLSKTVATRAFGAPIVKLLKKGLLLSVSDDLYVHDLVGQMLLGPTDSLSDTAAKAVAKHLKEAGIEQGEPLKVIRAAELLASSGNAADAVTTLTSGWESARHFPFVEAFLKSVASIPSTPATERRLKLLSARARLKLSNSQALREELEELARDKDTWTQSRALAALTEAYAEAAEPPKSVKAFRAVQAKIVGKELYVAAGVAAANALTRLNRFDEAETLARTLLAMVKGDKSLLDREGELRRLVARIYAQAGDLENAVTEAQAAAKAFEAAGDLYHAATAHGFVGDIYRETGDFELAKAAFLRFHDQALKWGDRDLVQVAELADAWVSLDIGDLTHAAKQIAAVEKDLSPAPSRRLKRYLAAARALLDAGRGKHAAAAEQLARVIEVWDSAAQRALADILRAQQVRSLIAANELDSARTLVDAALKRLDVRTQAPRVAMFLRESALIRLRLKDVKAAMGELAQARKLFGKGGNRREEALTLYRIAHAAFEEGDLDLAQKSAQEALELGRKIKHARVVAQCLDLQGRLALVQGDAKSAASLGKQALQALRKLGDEMGTLHVSEALLRALIAAGDLAGAIRLGPKVSEQAEKLEIREVRVRAIILTGVALIRRGRVEPATRCFRELGESSLSPLTTALMWRLGEALAAVTGQLPEVLSRRALWVAAVKRLPDMQQQVARRFLEQLDLPPNDRSILKTKDGEQSLSNDDIAWHDVSTYPLFIDVLYRRVLRKGQAVAGLTDDQLRLFAKIAAAEPPTLPMAEAFKVYFNEEPGDKPEKKLKAPVAELQKAFKDISGMKVEMDKVAITVTLPKNVTMLVPSYAAHAQLSSTHKKVLRQLRRYGTLPLNSLQEELKLNRAATRRELNALVKLKLVQAVRDGRGQAFRLI